MVAAPAWFATLRDGRKLPRALRPQAARYATIFTVLRRAGIARSSLYEAWDFTVASRQSLTNRMLSIRNAAFAQLGDHTLADGVPQGTPPPFTVTGSTSLSPQVTSVTGTFDVPCYLTTCRAKATTGFHYSSHAADGRLMLNPAGLASNPAFQASGHSLLDTSHLYYDGNSQGGIMGGMTTALAPDFRRAALGVSGMNYGGVLLLRSTDFVAYSTFLYPSYPDKSMQPMILDLIQQLWDRGEPDGYAQQMTTHPLPDTPSHTVLMQIAYGDHQVSDYAAAVEARTIGVSAHEPALEKTTNRVRDRNMFYGIPAIGTGTFGGSAIVIWDSGPGRVSPPPLTDAPPPEIKGDPTTQDPHPDSRNTVAARTQKSDFLEPNGTVVDVCGGAPCRTDAFTP